MINSSKQHGIILDCIFNGMREEGRVTVYPVSSDSTFDFSVIGVYVGSCKGLLYFVHETDGEYYICNPTTNEYKLLPPSPFDPPPGFDANIGSSGFGYDSRSDDYKVIRLVDYFYYGDDQDSDSDTERETPWPYPQDEEYAELYSFKNGTWKRLADFPPIAFEIPCVYADGCFYWSQIQYMVVFDFAEETFSTISLEDDISESLKDVSGAALVERDGCLGVLANTSTCVALWVKSKTGWNKVFEFDAPADLDPLGICKKGNAEFCYFKTSDCQLWIYDCDANKLEKLQINVRCESVLSFVSYAETTESISSSLRSELK